MITFNTLKNYAGDFVTLKAENIEEAIKYIINEYRDKQIYEDNKKPVYDRMSLLRKSLVRQQVKLAIYEKRTLSYDDFCKQISYINGYTPEEVKQEHELMNKKFYKYEGYPYMSKEEEISILEKLCFSDSYFAQEFRDKFEQMKKNIINDLPLMNNL